MGYDTEFRGEFAVEPPLSPEHAAYLRAFNRTPRMRRDEARAATRPDPIRLAAELPVGIEGGYYVGDDGLACHTGGPDVVDENRPPGGQPELWCHWVPSPDGRHIVWDGQRKFYEYEHWMAYMIRPFLAPWGYRVNGVVSCMDEDWCEPSELLVEANRVYFLGDEV